MKIEIIVQNNEGRDEAEKMGIKWEPQFGKTNFHFRSSALRSVWYDESANEIVMGIDGADYRTAYRERLYNNLIKIIESD
jgi:hypothetical protein